MCASPNSAEATISLSGVDSNISLVGRESDIAVDCIGLRKFFGDTLAVDAVDISIGRGEFVALLGPSGCGKTTLLRMIGGFETPSAGKIMIGDRDVALLPPNRRPTNMVFQSGALFPHLDVNDNVAYGLRVDRLPRAEIAARIADVIGLLGLKGLESRRPHQLSGGQAQRVAIARALVKRPSVLLLDEPLSALDLQLQLRLRRELADLHQRLGTTFIFVTHNQQEALELSDRIAVMESGRIRQIGGGQEIYNRPSSLFVARFIGETNEFSGLVAGHDGARTMVDVGENVGAQQADLPVGAKVRIAVRPGAVHWHAGGEGQLKVVVASVHHMGSSVRLRLERSTGADGERSVIVDLLPTATIPQRGQKGSVSWSLADAMVFPEEGR